MNHLAHLYLADPTPEARAGNFGADFFKGRVDRHDPRIQPAIRLHRAVDAFTDAHPVVSMSKARVRPACGNFSGVVIDVAYDHVLASRWRSYSTEPLQLWANQVYGELRAAADLLPVGLRSVLPRMIGDNWLVRYEKLAGVERALGFLLRRVGRERELGPMVEAVSANADELESDFHRFFPELIRHAEEVKLSLSG